MSIYKQLQQKELSSTPIKVCVIGCGRFGSMIIFQIKYIPGMEVSVICDLNIKRAITVASEAGISESNLKVHGSVDSINDSIKKNEVSIVDDASIAVLSNVDVVVEATGNPLAGAHNAINAIQKLMNRDSDDIQSRIYNVTSFNSSASEFFNLIKRNIE